MLQAQVKSGNLHSEKNMTINKRNLYWLILSVIIIVLDQLSKNLIVTHLTYGNPMEILPVFNLTLTHNPGAAFSFLSTDGGWQRWLFTAIAVLVSVFIIVWLLRLSEKETLTKIGLSFVFGGALGNLYDRLHYGYVIDFIQVHYHNWYYPDFNVADSAITVGACFIILALLFERERATNKTIT